MKRSRIPPGIFTRIQGGALRYYGRIARRRVALVAPGDKRATTSLEVATALYTRLIAEDQKRQLRAVHGVAEPMGLGQFAEAHLIAKTKAGRVTDGWVAGSEAMLRRATEFFGGTRELATITTADVRRYAEYLLTQPNGRGGHLSAGSVGHHLGALSNLFRRAAAEGLVQSNPVSFLLEKPQGAREESRWLEPPDAALLLESARVFKSEGPGRRAVPFIHVLLATFMLTGGRESEVLGLEVGDVSLDRNTVTFRPNQWRRLKTKRSHRTIPLWPQLREILEQYLAERPPTTLLFPSFRTGRESMVTDWRKVLDAVVARGGELYVIVDGHRRRAEPGDIRSKCFRHTYCATRLQTVDSGKPVAVYTVSRELGHSSTGMVEAVYSHLGDVRHRSDVVEFRCEGFATILGERLRTLRARVGDPVCDSV